MVDIPTNLEGETKAELIVLIEELVAALEEAEGTAAPAAGDEKGRD